jgi:putative flippase GtrA
MIKRILNVSAARWFIVGSATFLIDTALFLTAFHFTEIAVVSNLFSGTIATTFNYFSHYHWSFSSDRSHKQSTTIYLTVFFSFMFIGTTALSLLIHNGVEPLYAKVGLAMLTAPLTFLISKYVTFRKSSNDA